MRDAGSGVGGHRVGSLVRRRVWRAAGASRSRQVHRTTCRPRSRNRSSRTFSSVLTWPAVLPGGSRRPYVISPSNPRTTVDSRPTRSRRWRATGRTRRAPRAAGRERGARPCGTGHGSVTPRGSAPCTTAAEMWLTTAGGRARRADAPHRARRARARRRVPPRARRVPSPPRALRHRGTSRGRAARSPRAQSLPDLGLAHPRGDQLRAPHGRRTGQRSTPSAGPARARVDNSPRCGQPRPTGVPVSHRGSETVWDTGPPVGPVLRNRAGRRGRPSGRWPGW
jgi:hypothetical protein